MYIEGGGIEMSNELTEQKVLKKLGIEDFRHLTKDKVITMASLLDKMDPEVAKKAIEQFPNFSDTMKSALHDYKDSLDKAQKANADSVKSFYDSSDAIITSLQKELDKSDQTFEERKYIIDKMAELNKAKGDKDSENKKFITMLAMVGAAALGIITVSLTATLGGNTKIELPENNGKMN